MKNSKKIMLIALLALQAVIYTNDDSRTWSQFLNQHKYKIAAGIAIAGVGTAAMLYSDEFMKLFYSMSPTEQEQVKNQVEQSIDNNEQQIEVKLADVQKNIAELENATEDNKHSAAQEKMTAQKLQEIAQLEKQIEQKRTWSQWFTQSRTIDKQKTLDDKLMSAVMDNNIDSLKVALFEGANPNKVEKVSGILWNSTITPLEAAIRQNHGEELRLLLANGATTDGLNDQDKVTLDFMLHKDDPKFMNKMHPVEIRTGWINEQNNQEGDELDRFLAPFIERYKRNNGQYNPEDYRNKENDLGYQIVKRTLVDTPKYNYWGQASLLDDDEKVAKLVIAVKERVNNKNMLQHFLGGNYNQSILNGKAHIGKDFQPQP